MVAILTFALAACGKPQQTVQEDSSTVVAQPSNIEDPEQNAPDPTKASEADGKTLIVYFSWSSSGNTEKMANYIQEQTGGDLLKLEPQNPYPKDYNETGDIAKTERDEMPVRKLRTCRIPLQSMTRFSWGILKWSIAYSSV